jgi:hypothetical protein
VKKSVDVSFHYFDPETGLSFSKGMDYIAENLLSLDLATVLATKKLHELFGNTFIPEWESEWVDDFEYSHTCYNWERGFGITIHEIDIDLTETYRQIDHARSEYS